MKGFHYLKKEVLAIIKNRKILVSLIGVLLIPILYSGMFIYAFWDPYLKLDQLPVAVVNLDKGATIEGETFNAGSDLATKLKETPNFKWKFVKHDEAIKGLKDREYYMMIEIPDDFSQKATTLLNAQPEKMDILFIPNESFNFLGAQIGSTAVEKMKEAISHTVTEKYVQVMTEKIKVSAPKVGQLADGADRIRLGLQNLQSNLPQLVNGSYLVSNGATNLSQKIDSLNQGSQKLKSGADQLNQGLAALSPNVIRAIETHPGLTSQQKQQLIDGINKAAGGSQNLSASAANLANGASQLNEGGRSLAVGATTLYESEKQVENGVAQLAGGSTQLADGAQTMSSTINILTGNGLTADKQKYFSDPVGLVTEKYTPVPNYGTGFAPYFLSLGLYVGALLLSIVLMLRVPATIPKSPGTWFMGKFILLAAIGIVQGLIADGILLFVVGLPVQSVPAFIIVSLVTSITFVSLIQFLVTSFENPGRFIAIIILILQLTASAGTFPLELIPEPLQWVNAWLPMTYSVSAMKAVISSGDYVFMWKNIGILCGFTLLFMMGTFSYFKISFKKNLAHLSKKEDYGDDHPVTA